jgi:hypothetical protein
MSDIYQSSVQSSVPGFSTDWLEEERRKKKKKNRADTPYDPNTGFAGPQPGIGGVPSSPTTPIDVQPGLGGGGGGGIGPVDTSRTSTAGGGQGDISTDPSVYNNAAKGASITPFPGSFASGVAKLGDNPFAQGAFANSPILIANQMLGQKYGLPAGSRTGSAMANIFDAHAKAIGLGSAYPTNNADWINLGASLMEGFSGPNGAWGFSPGAMMANAVQAIQAEVTQMAAGGSGGGDKFTGPLAELAHDDPSQALQKFGSLIAGMLTGSMPDDEIQSYVDFLMRSGTQFLQEFYSSHNAAADEAAGLSFISALVQKLGPRLGL